MSLSTTTSAVPTSSSAQPAQLRSVAERLNVFQDLEAKDQRFDQFARDLTNQLFILFRSASLYELDNVALDQPYQSFLKSVSELYDILRAPIALRHNEGNFFVNRRQVKLDFSTFQNTRYLAKIFERLDINELKLEPEVSRSDLKQLLNAFLRIAEERRGSLRDVTITHVLGRKLKIGEVHPLLTSEGVTERIVAWYTTARFTTQNFYQDAAAGRTPEHALLKRTVLALVELPSAARALLSCLDLLNQRPEEGGALFTQSVEAAGITQVIAEGLQLNADTRLALATAAFQLFQGWTLIGRSETQTEPHTPEMTERFEPVDHRMFDSTARVFAELERSPERLRDFRNEIVRTLLSLGGVSESVITRSVITFEAQRAVKTQWESGDEARSHVGERRKLARPRRASALSRLYQSGFGRSFLTDIVYAAHLYTHLKRERGVLEAMRALRQSTLLPEVKRTFYELLGSFSTGSVVEFNDGRFAVVTQCRGDQVREAVIIEPRPDSTIPQLGPRLELRETSPIKVKRALTEAARDAVVSRSALCALLFSRHAYVTSV